jgi:hypothetical protein
VSKQLLANLLKLKHRDDRKGGQVFFIILLPFLSGYPQLKPNDREMQAVQRLFVPFILGSPLSFTDI